MQRRIVGPPDLWENCSQEPPPTASSQEILESKDHSYKKLTQVRLHQNAYLKTEKQKGEPIPNIETGSIKTSFETKSKR